ncbi:MAG: hypothetical protein MUF22_08045, partial [Chitinispirillaceae bacterium]|nr:hypothetical protein [Chitinispirillaceae bacterium]
PSRGAESYVKDWKVLNLGTINLVKGTGTLALRALFVPGTQVMEFRELSLIRHDTTPPAPVKSGSNDSQDRPFSFNLSGNGNALQLRMNRSGPVRVEVYSTDGKLISRVQGGTPDGAGRSIILPLTTRTKGAGIVIFRFRMDNELYTARYALVN